MTKPPSRLPVTTVLIVPTQQDHSTACRVPPGLSMAPKDPALTAAPRAVPWFREAPPMHPLPRAKGTHRGTAPLAASEPLLGAQRRHSP